MAIKVASTLIPASKTYPISIANDILGGLHMVSTKADLSSIKPALLMDGMIVYIVDEKKYYLLDGTEWKPFSSGGGILLADELEDLDTIDKTTLKDGALCYVSSLGTYMKYNASDLKWEVQNKSFVDEVVVSDTAPKDTSALWLDTSGDRLTEHYTPELINSLVSDIRTLLKLVNYFKYAFENQINSGDFSNNTAIHLGEVETPAESITDGSKVIFTDTPGFTIKKKELKFYYDINIKYQALLTSFNKKYLEDDTVSDVIIEFKVGNETFTISKQNKTLKKEAKLFITSIKALDNFADDDIIFSLKGYAVKDGRNIPIAFSCIFGYGQAIEYEMKNWIYNHGDSPLEPTDKFIPNVTHICIKAGTKLEMQANKALFLDNELLWCTDTKQLYIKTQGILKLITGSGGPAPIDPDNPNINPDDPNTTIMNTEFLDVSNYINVKGKPTDSNPDGNGNVRIEDGNISSTSATIKKLLRANSLEVNYLNLGGGQYQAKVDDDGSISVYPWSDIVQRIPDTYISDLSDHQTDGMKASGAGTNSPIKRVYLNSLFAGGTAGIHDYRRCSHNFIELSNINDEDISLNGVSIGYTEDGVKWDVLELRGMIKAGSTYLIRGAQCSVIESNYTTIKVRNCDIEWRNSDGTLKQFSDTKCAFYLFIGNKATLDSYSTTFKANPGASIMEWNNSRIVPRGYVEVAGFYRSGSDSIQVNEGGACDTFGKNRLMYKYYQLDPTNAADKMRSFKNRKNSVMWTYIDLDKKGLPLTNVDEYAPKASNLKKNIYTMKSKFSDVEPNYVTCTFGRQASVPTTAYTEIVNGTEISLTGATRCFNWISTGYCDEYLWIAKKEELGKGKIFVERNGIGRNEDYIWVTASENNLYDSDAGCARWKGKAGIIESMDNQDSKERAAAYNRIHMEGVDGTNFTVHKVIVKDLQPGIYKYRVGRSLENYISEEFQFEVKSDAQLSTGWNFVLITDQQGFNWNEYEMHRMSCQFIADHEKKGGTGTCSDLGFDFTFNTGDMTQDGNRLSEWIDYYNGRKPLKDYVEMCVVGNNDLGPGNLFNETKGTDAEKINYNLYRWFYTFEIDEENPPMFTITDGEKTVDAFIDSLYSFNYGNAHFICVNSEVVDTKRGAIQSCNVIIYGMKEDTQQLLMPHIRRWAYADMTKVNKNKTDANPIKWRIATVHDCPFTILTFSTIRSYFTREGQLKYQDCNDNIGVKGNRSGSQLNYPYNNKYWKDSLYDDTFDTFWFSRFCQETGIRLCIGGHKHTHAVSKPIYENVTTNGIYNYRPVIPYTLGKNGDKAWSNYFTSFETHPEDNNYKVPASSNTEDKWNPNEDPGKINRLMGAWKQVNKVTAPGYVTCQATGYKHKSNKELPARYIPWEFEYTPYEENVPSGTSEKTDENPAQCRPYYMTYKITNDTLTYVSHGLTNIWQNDAKGKGFTFNAYPEQTTIGEYVPKTLQPGTQTTPSNKYVPIVLEYAPLTEIYANLKATVPYYTNAASLINLDTYADNMKSEYVYAAFKLSTDKTEYTSGENIKVTIEHVGNSLIGAEIFIQGTEALEGAKKQVNTKESNVVTLSTAGIIQAGSSITEKIVTILINSTKVPSYKRYIRVKVKAS